MFEDPRPGARMIEPQYSEMNAFNSNRLTVAAAKGRLLTWPSFLLHAIEAGRSESEEERIVIAFNVMIRTAIETITARLELKWRAEPRRNDRSRRSFSYEELRVAGTKCPRGYLPAPHEGAPV